MGKWIADRYKIMKELGHGKNSTVYLCRDYKEDCVVCGTSREINKDNFDKFDYDIFINQGK